MPARERRQQQTKRKRIAHASPEPQIARGLQPPARLQPGSRCTMSMHAAERPRRVDRTGRTPIIHHLAGRCVMALLALRHLHPVGHGWLVVASARGGRAPKEELRSKRNTNTPVKLCRGVYTTSTTSVANARHTPSLTTKLSAGGPSQITDHQTLWSLSDSVSHTLERRTRQHTSCFPVSRWY